HAGALKPLKKMLATPGDRFARQHEDRAANDAAVLSVVDDLVPLAEQTARWLRRAAREIRRQEEQAHEGDEASLKAALTAIEALRAPARHLADQAVAVLDVVQRAALGRQMVSEQADDVWWPDAMEQRAEMGARLASRGNYTRLGDFVEMQLAEFRSRWRPEWVKAPQWLLKVKPDIRKKPIQLRWLALYHPMSVIEANAEEIDAIHQRLQRDYQQVVGTRHRDQHAGGPSAAFRRRDQPVTQPAATTSLSPAPSTTGRGRRARRRGRRPPVRPAEAEARREKPGREK
ncbi:MAG TPA: hypothetical protein VGR26_15905, partial [Acidimicrobiales bacterium]|nr:hypothetical protein [Acidimicrobiales bacterium]